MTSNTGLDAWLNAYLYACPGDAPDLCLPTLQAHPDPDYRACIAINLPRSNVKLLGRDTPEPSSVAVRESFCQAVWWITVPVKTHAVTPAPDAAKNPQKAHNTWKQVSAALKNTLAGVQALDLLVNPQFWDGDPTAKFEMRYGPQMLQNLADLKGFWVNNPQHPARTKLFWKISYDTDEARRLGGMTRSVAQQEARRANFAKARETAAEVNRARGLKKAEQVIALVDKKLTNEQIAEHLGIGFSSVPKTVQRARATLGLQEHETKPAETPEAVLYPQAVVQAPAAPQVELPPEDVVNLSDLLPAKP